MDPLLVSSSPYIQEQHDFQPSSSASAHFDINHSESPYLVDSFAFDQDYQQDSGHFPHTPSYNGSYQNSPYSVLSDLPTFDNADDPDALALFEDNPSGISITEEYDPAEYDVPDPSGLLSFDGHYMSALDSANPQVSVSITPPSYENAPSPSAYDHPSPASSNGADDDHRSRASSSSSYMPPNSPPLNDFTQNFESMHFESPSWSSSQLPQDRRSPPAQQKAHSPPQLVIPDIASPATTVHDEPPTINAPDGDGMLTGPQLHIVPATPISGGGGVTQNVAFLQQGNTQENNQQSWDQPQHLAAATANQSMASASQYPDQSQPFYPGSNHSSPGMSYTPIPQDSSSPPARSRPGPNFLIPQVPLARSRSLSDTSLRPPTWDTAPMSTTVNMNDVLPGPGSSSPSPSPMMGTQRLPSSAGAHQTTFGQTLAPPGRLQPHNSFGPPNTNLPPSYGSSMGNDFLSADIRAADLRRAKSDSMRGFGHRQVRSEDLRSYSPSSLYPPMGQSTQEFIRNASRQQFLHPTQSLIPSIRQGHHRRSSSGSRERPIGWQNAVGSSRASPYPSPSASPRPGYPSLPGGPELGMGIPRHPMSAELGMPMGFDTAINMQVGVGQEAMTITKVNVTTPSTADASQKRRKQPANFACPVPGCGSTFTRHFNLKGHLRSHAEEKPYQCKWPGCGKGFARQHDCKRHEQLHLNIRPYPCEGCKKNFARMDALNRHLRSEGGAECRKIQKEIRPNGDDAPEASDGSTSSSLKPDPDATWNSGSLVM
ncbi:transcription factor [Phanerochaete sordida]|uniref:Transcription factor n=1 Tax=Phanerochaete sordida TaxID=48140 RepID=A0A9P3LBY8_9APHY|nr:transcription factor [Phanerochaete sordida]